MISVYEGLQLVLSQNLSRCVTNSEKLGDCIHIFTFFRLRQRNSSEKLRCEYTVIPRTSKELFHLESFCVERCNFLTHLLVKIVVGTSFETFIVPKDVMHHI